MSKKKILIPGWSLGDSSFGVTKPYLEFFSQFGQVEVLTPRKEIVECDLLVLSGGLDMDSFDYDEVPGFFNSNIDVYKNYFYKQNLPQYVEAKIPIFGICLGMQELAVYFGSKLTQNLMYHSENSNPRNELIHEVYSVTRFDEAAGKYIFKRPGKDDKHKLKVNSMHHQGVEVDKLSNALVPLLLADNYPEMLVEAFKHKELPIAAVQYHPEETYCDFAITQIQNLLELNEKKILQA